MDLQRGYKITKSLNDYQPCEVDEAGTTKYYGFITSKGSWYIMQHDTTTGTIRYAGGFNNFTSNWSNRVSLTYKRWDDVSNTEER